MTRIKTVHVVFKTHLDIGFTELARNVLDTYEHEFIPKAIELAEQMNGDFIWTTGSWLIDRYLKTAPPEQRERMEEAIRKGYIAWHGLPFTTHTEAAESKLFDYGLSISKKLDQMYRKKTIAGKMTDVPGHTISLVTKLAQNGIQYLHLGVNPSSTVPGVPPVFVWRNEDGAEVIVNYHDSYGDALTIEGFEEALVFAHTMDNHGPQTKEEVYRIYETLLKQFPDAEVKASTLDAFAARLLTFKDHLPVVFEEIGDSWIHGIASDPLKISKYRTLIRLRDKWLVEGRLTVESEEYELFSEALLLIPEHTWGLDTKRFLPDYVNWAKEDFQRARKESLIPSLRVPEIYAYLSDHALRDASEKWGYDYLEESWEEQNAYIEQAIQSLSEDKQAEVTVEFEKLRPNSSAEPFKEVLYTHEPYQLGSFYVTFGDDGAIERLVDKKGKEWADEENQLGVFSYQTFGDPDYQTWFDQYHVKMKQNKNWVTGDFGKPGLELILPKPENLVFKPILNRITLHRDPDGSRDVVRVELRMTKEAAEKNGAPRRLIVEYQFDRNNGEIDVSLSWFSKDANRMPEASWFSFVPKVDNPNMWKVDKLGQWISPLMVVKGGNRSMHASETGVKYYGADGKVQIESNDAPLVSFGEPRLLRFEDTFADMKGGLHFSLHNNVWGTNFRMWFEEDMKFRFNVRLESF